jgi:spore maturation protein CgeB
MTSHARILIARGAYGDVYEPAWHRAFLELGFSSELYDTHSLTLPGTLGRIERRILWGPGVARIQRNLVELVKRGRPEFTLLFQGHYFPEDTIEQIRRYTYVVGYHNDDPFGRRRNLLRYRLMLPALRHYHAMHVYRPCNVGEAFAYGVRRVKVLLPYYLPWLDYPRTLTREETQRYGCEVAFAGHAEADIRVDSLASLVRSGVKARIYGSVAGWRSMLPRDVYSSVVPVAPVFGNEYRKALCGAEIALCFMSKWNRDQYTRRAFEIPACGAFLLSERTPAMQELFREGAEADYFSSVQECLDKVEYYLAHPVARRQIAEAGRRKVEFAGHDIYSRMRQWYADVSQWRMEFRDSRAA